MVIHAEPRHVAEQLAPEPVATPPQVPAAKDEALVR